jgi:hypothetical protein
MILKWMQRLGAVKTARTITPSSVLGSVAHDITVQKQAQGEKKNIEYQLQEAQQMGSHRNLGRWYRA